MPPDRSEIPVSLVLKPRDFVINTDDPVVVNYVGGIFEVVFEAGFVKYLSVWKLSLRKIIATGLLLAQHRATSRNLVFTPSWTCGGRVSIAPFFVDQK